MEKFVFLSPEWVEQTKRIREAHKGNAATVGVVIRMNQLVTDLPDDAGEVRTFIDTSDGYLNIELGELANPDVSVVVDYQTARSLFVDLDAQAAIAAFMAGRIKVTGDLTKLMALQGNIAPGDAGLKMAEEIKAITL